MENRRVLPNDENVFGCKACLPPERRFHQGSLPHRLSVRAADKNISDSYIERRILDRPDIQIIQRIQSGSIIGSPMAEHIKEERADFGIVFHDAPAARPSPSEQIRHSKSAKFQVQKPDLALFFHPNPKRQVVYLYIYLIINISIRIVEISNFL